jgi:uncharacterized protein (TIGR02996 family)
MSDEDALLAAVVAHPAEDTPRLVFADWLDEHGRHARAEFIRVQVAIAQKEHLPRADLNRYVDLYKRNQELIDDHRAELLGPLSRLPDDAEVQFHRGFPEEVTLSVFHFNQLRDALAETRPLPRVAVRDAVGLVRGFLGINFFPPVEPYPELALNLVTAVRTAPGEGEDDWRWPSERDQVLVLPLRWPRLAELDLSGCQLGDYCAGNLLSESYFPALTDLDLSANDLTDRAVESLLLFGLPRRLKRLVLGGNLISDDGAEALASGWPVGEDDRLEHLNLRFTHIGPAGQSALLRRFGGRVDLF